jgi:2-oxoglutarate ferredoxin oxidoreductase subunit alpha
MMDFAIEAFDLADRYRTPVMIMAEGTLGQMMEPILVREPVHHFYDKPWATNGCQGRLPNIVNTLHLSPEFLEERNHHLQSKYNEIIRREKRAETYLTEDADLVVVSFGLMARVVRKAVMEARKNGFKVGMIRPVTLWPFPDDDIIKVAQTAKRLLSVEISMGQMVEDIRLAVAGRIPVDFYGRIGITPNPEEILREIVRIAEREGF